MITFEQIPLVRLSAKRLLERGEIEQREYNQVIRALDKLEEEYRNTEKRNQERMIHNLNRAFSFA